MKNQEKIIHFIEDALFLEKNRIQIEGELKALDKKKSRESKRKKYKFSEKTQTLASVFGFIIVYTIAMLIVYYIIVPLIHFVLIDILLSILNGFKTMPPYKTFDTVCNIIIGILLFIPVLLELWDYISEKFNCIKENKEKTIHDENEDRRLEHFNITVLPKLQDEEKTLKQERNNYNAELQKLYELNIVPPDYCNLEAIYIMHQYMTKYKVTDIKTLLNSCDKYFRYKDLKQNIQTAQEHLEDTQRKIISEFEDTISSIDMQVNTFAMQIENQNFELERLEEHTQREKRNSEIILYWNL